MDRIGVYSYNKEEFEGKNTVNFGPAAFAEMKNTGIDLPMDMDKLEELITILDNDDKYDALPEAAGGKYVLQSTKE